MAVFEVYTLQFHFSQRKQFNEKCFHLSSKTDCYIMVEASQKAGHIFEVIILLNTGVQQNIFNLFVIIELAL